MPEGQFFIEGILGLNVLNFPLIGWAGYFNDRQADGFSRGAKLWIVAERERHITLALGQTGRQRHAVETGGVGWNFGDIRRERSQPIDLLAESGIRA